MAFTLWPHACVHAYTSEWVCVCDDDDGGDDVVAVVHGLPEQNLAGDEYSAWRVHFLLAFNDLSQEQ